MNTFAKKDPPVVEKIVRAAFSYNGWKKATANDLKEATTKTKEEIEKQRRDNIKTDVSAREIEEIPGKVGVFFPHK